MNAAVVLDVGELLAAHDRSVRGPGSAPPRFGTVVERIGPLTLTHYGTHCIVDHPALDASASAAQLAAQVQQRAAARVEPVEWRVFAHDAEASQLTASLEGAGFTRGWERSVLVGEVAELDLPQPQPEWKIESVRWDELQVQPALDLSASSGPHRVPLATWHAMGSIPYWDIDIRVLTHRGRVTAACWLETIRGTAFAAVGGLTASRPELLAQLPLWRFQPPAKEFLVAEADGQLRSSLTAVGFRDVTTVRSHHWTPPGEPAATPPARHSLHDAESGRIARRCEARIGFDYASGSGRYTAPLDSRRWFYGMLDRGTSAIATAEGIIERGMRACVRPGEWVYESRPYLNGWEFDPHRVGGPGQPPWPGSAIADDEFQFLATADARLGTFAHYAEQALVVFGDDLIEQVADDLDHLLGDGAWTFG
ncbi:DUF2716 domain-containing protein [Streptomyces sp. TLI_105]|uniref:DUF2716 domain-containing protein n=1 Tax=Streptomyces sp. TLI_105 TaxID=1881019 RepID=UPI0008999CB0|nr:DUF2716 domain-containing protein [Streptomyces sp. TLI_105]SEE61557.1 Protein of unknown function [Streptomyces sp. TLI_105]